MNIIKQDFLFNNSKINILGTINAPLFFGSQVAKILGYKNPRESIREHVWNKNKTTIKEYINKDGAPASALKNLQPHAVLINEPGLYQLIFRSSLSIAQEFQDYIFTKILPEIRKGNIIHKQLILLNEGDLHKKVVEFIRKYYNDVRLITCCGENQDTKEKRIESYKKGYERGISDLIIDEPNHRYNGFEIEFKTPKGTGTTNNNQIIQKNKSEIRNKKHIISDDYDNIIYEIIQYMNTRRIYCNYCIRKFKNEHTLKNHYKYFHRIYKNI